MTKHKKEDPVNRPIDAAELWKRFEFQHKLPEANGDACNHKFIAKEYEAKSNKFTYLCDVCKNEYQV